MASVDDFRSLQGASDEVISNVCGPCLYQGKTTEAIDFCIDCKEVLCRRCTDYHKGFRTSRNHKIVELKELSKSKGIGRRQSCSVRCVCDQNLEVTIYCEDHCDVICQTCATIKHRKCNLVDIDDKETNYTVTRYDSVERRANSMNKKIKNFLVESNLASGELLAKREICKKDIQTLRHDCNTLIDRLEKDAVRELDATAHREQLKLEHNVSTVTGTKKMIETDTKLLEDMKIKSNKRDMFAADVRVSNHLAEIEKVIKDVSKEFTLPTLTFERNKQLIDLLTQIKAIGTLRIEHEKLSKSNVFSFRQAKIEYYKKIDIQMHNDTAKPSITGFAFLPDSRVILCDNHNNKIKVSTPSFEMTESLKLNSSPCDISLMNDSTAIITIPGKKQLLYVKVEPKLVKLHNIQLDMECWGIDIVGENIYITCHQSGLNGEVRILDIEGKFKRRLRVHIQANGSALFVKPFFLAVSKISKKNVYVSDADTSIITCLSADDSILYRYQAKAFTTPGGLCTDDEDNVIVVSEDENTVQVITADGQKHQTLLTDKDGFRAPHSVGYRAADNTLFVGCYRNKTMWVLKLTV